MTFMTDGLYDGDPLTPEEREEFEEDLISFCDRELDLLGDIHSLNVLYAGGVAPLWLEGLSQLIGGGGSLTAIEADADLVEQARESLEDAGLSAPVSLVAGSVFEPPFASGVFDLVYSAGLLHELDVREKPAEDVLAALARVIRPGGRMATSDWVDTGEEPSPADLEWERMEAEAEYEISGMRLHGIGSPERLIRLHEKFLHDTRWRVSPPYPLRYLDKVMLSEPDESAEYAALSGETRRKLLTRRAVLKKRIRREGYRRPATLYVEGWKNPPNG